MRDYLSLGSTPAGEECAQVGSADYYPRMRREAKAYIGQLERMFPAQLETGIYFVNKGFPHDFGTYHEVCVIFNDQDEAQIDAAYHIENNLPESWDGIAQLAMIDPSADIGSTYVGNRMITKD